jgi:hypothetical protein
MSIGLLKDVRNMFTMMLVDQKQTFKEWINKIFVEWRGDSRKSVTDFARDLNVSQQVMNGWLNYGSIPSSKNLFAIAEKFPEIYDVLDLPRPELSPVNARLLLEASKDLSRSAKDAGIDINDPAFEKLFIEIFSKHGINVVIMD